MTGSVAIESIPLYTHLDRIGIGLAALGIGPADPIRPEQLFPLDQWHYHGTDAIRAAAEQLRLGPASRYSRSAPVSAGPRATSRTPRAAMSPRLSCNPR